MSDMLADWRALPARAGAIRAVLIDVDGCLTAGEGQPLDLQALAACAAINQRARHDPLTPALTLCTGRPAPYVEVLLQAIGGFLPALAEHGGLLLWPLDYRFARHPLLADAREALEAVRAAVLSQVVGPEIGFVQPGKETMLTLYAAPGVELGTVLAAAQAAVAPFAAQFAAEFNHTCVEVRRRGVDKGSGTAWMAEQLGLPLAALAGVGDSDSDLSFLTEVGYPAAPANAIEAVRARVGYVATQPHARGVLEIVERIEAHNRALPK